MWWNSMSVLQQVMFIIACAATSILVIQIILMLIGGASDGDADIDVGGGADVDADISLDGASDVDADIGIGSMADFDEPPSVIGGHGGISDGSLLDADADASDASDAYSAAPKSGGSILPFGLKLLSLRSILAFIAVGAWLCYTLIYVMPVYGAILVAVVGGFAAACGVAAALVGMEKLQSSGNINPNNTVGKIGTVYLTIPANRSGQGKINITVQERYAEYDAITDSDEPIPTGTEIQVTAHVGSNVLLVKRYKKPNITIENS